MRLIKKTLSHKFGFCFINVEMILDCLYIPQIVRILTMYISIYIRFTSKWTNLVGGGDFSYLVSDRLPFIGQIQTHSKLCRRTFYCSHKGMPQGIWNNFQPTTCWILRYQRKQTSVITLLPSIDLEPLNCRSLMLTRL